MSKSHKSSASRKRFDRIYETIHLRICLLDYPPNMQLSEDELAEEFAVSRTPIRRVLSRLETEGLVESRHGVGTIVTDVDINALLEVYQMRIELAKLMGKMNPRRRTERDIAKMRGLLQRAQDLEVAPNLKRFAQLNMDVHNELTAMIGNTPLKETVRRLFFFITRIWLTTLTSESLPHETKIFRREIEEINIAFAQGDLKTVGYTHRNHIAMSYARLKSYANAQPDPIGT